MEPGEAAALELLFWKDRARFEWKIKRWWRSSLLLWVFFTVVLAEGLSREMFASRTANLSLALYGAVTTLTAANIFGAYAARKWVARGSRGPEAPQEEGEHDDAALARFVRRLFGPVGVACASQMASLTLMAAFLPSVAGTAAGGLPICMFGFSAFSLPINALLSPTQLGVAFTSAAAAFTAVVALLRTSTAAAEDPVLLVYVAMLLIMPLRMRILWLTRQSERKAFFVSHRGEVLRAQLNAHHEPTQAETDALRTALAGPLLAGSRADATQALSSVSLSAATARDNLVLTGKVGSGSQAEVYLARLKGKRVAAKVLRRAAAADAERVSLFLHDGLLLATLRHACVVELIGVVLQPPRLVLLLEHASRGSWRQVLDDKRLALSWTGVLLGAARDAASAVAYIHGLSRPVYHADLKAANVRLDHGRSVFGVPFCVFVAQLHA